MHVAESHPLKLNSYEKTVAGRPPPRPRPGAEPVYRNGRMRQLIRLYGHVCLACGARDRRLTLGHVLAYANGGSKALDNLQPLCEPCNFQQGTKTVDYRENRW